MTLNSQANEININFYCSSRRLFWFRSLMCLVAQSQPRSHKLMTGIFCLTTGQFLINQAGLVKWNRHGGCVEKQVKVKTLWPKKPRVKTVNLHPDFNFYMKCLKNVKVSPFCKCGSVDKGASVKRGQRIEAVQKSPRVGLQHAQLDLN